jgi:hypothetical protein
MELRSFIIEDSIQSPLTHAIEVTIQLHDGERRWCYFATPDSLARFGDWIDDTEIRIHYGAPHLIVLAQVTPETIESALKHIDANGEFRQATREFESDERQQDAVWVFNGTNSSTPSAVFRHRTDAEHWIAANKLTGMLTLYPVDVPVYDWAIEKGYFTPKQDYQSDGAFIGRFSSASQEHYHYEDGHQ